MNIVEHVLQIVFLIIHQVSIHTSQIFLLGKVSDELLLKIVEVKRIQGNNHVGTLKCQTRDFFSFFPQVINGYHMGRGDSEASVLKVLQEQIVIFCYHFICNYICSPL